MQLFSIARTYRLRERLHHGPLSHQVIALAATGQLLYASRTSRTCTSAGSTRCTTTPTWATH